MPNFRDRDELNKQYSTSQNLNKRILLHQLFSTNKLGWSNWVFQNYIFKPNQNILELGCGNGGAWQSNADKMPHDIKLVLSDFSSGMLDSAKENTKSMNCIEYQVIDAQDIPFANGTFDIIIANHMLYHVPNLDKALGEISRVIKPDGTFYATTIGNDNLKEIIKLLHDYDSKIDFAQTAATESFGLESGVSKLRKYFNSVEVRKYADSLHITEPKPLIDYILSLQGIGNVNEIISGERVTEFSNYVSDFLEEKGYFDVIKDAGTFISNNPV